MRLPVNSPYRFNAKFGATGKAYLGDSRVHNGVDIVSDDRQILAPESGTVTTGNDSVNGNYIVLVSGNFRHFLGHLASFRKRGPVKEGDLIAIMGTTGQSTGVHVHWSLRRLTNGKQGPIEDPLKYVTKGGAEVADRTQVNNIYKAVMHREGDKGGLDNYTGRDANSIISEFMGSQEFKNHQAFLANATKQIQALQTALANEKNKKPEVVTKEVEKIVTKIEKIEVPVIDPTIHTKLDTILNVLRIIPAWIGAAVKRNK